MTNGTNTDDHTTSRTVTSPNTRSMWPDENGDWLRNGFHPRLVKDTITCGACPPFHQATVIVLYRSANPKETSA